MKTGRDSGLIFLLVFSVLIVNFTSGASSLECPTGWLLYEPASKCMNPVFRDTPYDQAAAGCQSICDDCRVARVKSLEENQFLDSVLGGNSPWVWLGITRLAPGTFQYDGEGELLEPTSYAPWAALPNDNLGCVARTPGQQFFNMECATPTKYICERPALVPTAPVKTCEEGWYYYKEDDICLKAIHDRQATYQEAGAHCQSLFGVLAFNVFTYEQRRVINAVMKIHDHFWIAVDDLDRDGVWQYADMTNVEGNPPYGPGEPHDPAVSPAEVCMTMKCGRWYDQECDNKYHFICQKLPVEDS